MEDSMGEALLGGSKGGSLLLVNEDSERLKEIQTMMATRRTQ